MNILQINTSDSKGGAAKNVYRFKKRLEELGHSTSIFVGYKFSNDKNVFLINPKNVILEIGSKLIKRNLTGYIRRKISFYRGNDIDFFNIDNLFNSPEYKKADIVHFRNLHGDYFNLNALKKISTEKPIVWTLHDLWAITGHCAHPFDCEKWKIECQNCPYLNTYPAVLWDNTQYLWNKKRAIYNNSKLNIVANSLWTKERAEKSILKNQNIRLIYNGIDDEVFKPYNKKEVRQKLSFPSDKKIILFSAIGGKKNPFKGWQFIEKTLEHYKNDKGILFLSIGGKKEGQFNNIRYIKYIDDDSLLAKYYSVADIFLYPSLADTFGLVVAESLACGTPVITFNTGGIPELVFHKKNGYIAKYKDFDDLINGIEYIFGLNETEIKEMSKNCVKKIKENFTLDKMTEEYLKLYKEILNFS
ncbi:hypothetical protein AMJ49_03100 [Parcubacteria bacterium DG_74_2]|nr:MAG: hypothetical protein AMJ49_03100 [Parcubacteria bacterium DG_74_2]